MKHEIARVVCCGLATLDVIQQVDRLPGPDEKIQTDVLLLDAGGPATNAAASVISLGGEARLLTGLGSGPVSHLVRDLLVDAGVETRNMFTDARGDIAVSTVLTNRHTGERAVISTNARLTVGQLQLHGDELDGASVLLLDGHYMGAALELAASARSLGIPVVFDGGSWKQGTEQLLRMVDFAVLSSAFRTPSGTDPIQYVAELGCPFVATSAGGSPVVIQEHGHRSQFDVPQLSTEEVVDTLGAGDVLHGAFALLLAVHGAALSNTELLRRATLVATESCRHAGARGWAGNTSVRNQLTKLIEDGG